MTGCAASYWTDRGRDAADIFTVTVGVGGGAKARAGPIHGGLFVGQDKAGLRGGEARSYSVSGCEVFGIMSTEYTVLSAEGFGYGADRGKDYGARGYPLVSFVVAEDEGPLIAGKNGALHSYYTQLEVAVGVLGTVRLGLNPGEFMDFILGFTTIDVFNDDLAAANGQEEKSNQRMQQ